MGRPTKLTAELEAALVDAIRLGVPLSLACDRADVSVEAVLEWIRRGEGRDGGTTARPPAARYAQFAHAVKKARAEDQARRISRIEKAAKGGAVVHRRTTTRRDGTVMTEERYTEPQWTADAWHLERSDPEHWGRKDRHEVTGEGGGAVELVVKVIGAGVSMDDL